MGSTCLSYLTKNGRVKVKKYFSLPPEIIEDLERLLLLGKQALQVAQGLKMAGK
jgi:hypothetical protein